MEQHGKGTTSYILTRAEASVVGTKTQFEELVLVRVTFLVDADFFEWDFTRGAVRVPVLFHAQKPELVQVFQIMRYPFTVLITHNARDPGHEKPKIPTCSPREPRVSFRQLRYPSVLL